MIFRTEKSRVFFCQISRSLSTRHYTAPMLRVFTRFHTFLALTLCAAIASLLAAPRANAQVFADDFADGVISAYWQQVSASSALSFVERNGRAEFATTADNTQAARKFAGFLAKGWSIRSTSNWAARAVIASAPRSNGAAGTAEYVTFGTFRPGSPLSANGIPTQSKLLSVGTSYTTPQNGSFNRWIEYKAYDQFGGDSQIVSPWVASSQFPFEFYRTSDGQYEFDFTYTETLYLQYVAASDTLYVSTYAYGDPEAFFFTNWTSGQRYPVALTIGGSANRPGVLNGATTWIDSVRVDVGVLDTAPGNVAASDGTFGGKVRITWTAAANATGYKVLRQAPGGSVEQIAQLASAALAYDDTTAAPLVEYTYFVRTINAQGDGFEFSDTGWRNVATPTGVAASDGTFTDRVQVSWTPSVGAVGYSVWRAIGTATPVLLGQTSGADVTSYSDTTAAIATTYSYSVKAISVLGSTGLSTADTGVRAPAPPANVVAGEGVAAKIRVSWTALNGATGYRIYRRTEGGVPTQIAVVTSGTTTFYDDTTATPLVSYLYSVKATTTSVDSAASPEDAGWRNIAGPVLTASQGTSQDGVVLTWPSIAAATGFQLFRTAPGGSSQLLAELGVVTTFTDTTAEPLVTYSYTARAVHTLGTSPASTAVTGWRNVPGPRAATASDGEFAGKVLVQWSAVSGASGYTVWRRTSGSGSLAQIGAVTGGATLSYDDTTAVAGILYDYAVKATSSAGATAFSPIDTGWRNTTAPTSVAASDGAFGGKIRVTWVAPTGATGFKVFRTAPGGAEAELATIASATTLFYDDFAVEPVVSYAYRVRAVVAPGVSSFSAADTGWRTTAAPTNVEASRGTFNDKVRVTWAATTAATGYKIFRATSTTTPVQIGTISDGATTQFDDTTAAIVQSYTYTVQSVCALGNGLTSAGVTGFRAVAPPTNVAAGDGLNVPKVRVTWTAVNGATSYQVFRRVAGGTAAQIGTVTGGSTTFFDDTTAASLVSYLYSVKTVVTVADGSSSATFVSFASAEDAGWRNIAGPTLAASAGASTAQVNVTWSAVTGATGYQIFRTAPGSAETLIAELGAVTSYADTTATALVSYSYRAKAVHTLGLSGFGVAATGWRNTPGPATLAASDGAFAAKVNLTWTAVTGATGYTMWRKLPSEANYTQIGTVTGGSTLLFDDTTAQVAVTYNYAVRATHALGSTPNGVIDNGWRNTTGPTSVVATDGAFSDKVRLTWVAPAAATGFKVFRTAPGGVQEQIATIASATTLIYDDTTAVPAVQYTYRLRATVPQGDGPQSVAETGWRQLAAPVATASKGAFIDKVQVTWPAVVGATSYKVFRAIGTGANTQIGTVAAGGTLEFNDTTIGTLVSANYSVQAVSALGAGPTSAVNAGWRNIPAPTSVAATDGTFPTKVRVTWSAVPSATGYRVLRQIDGGTTTLLTTTNATTLVFEDTTIAVGQIGTYTIRANHALGATLPSLPDTGFRAPSLADGDTTGGGSDGGVAGFLPGDGAASDSGSAELDVPTDAIDGTGGNTDGETDDTSDGSGEDDASRPTSELDVSCDVVTARVLALMEQRNAKLDEEIYAELLAPRANEGDSDFTEGVSIACAIAAGDVDLDGTVTTTDLVAFLAAWAANDHFSGDVNRDGYVDAIDFAVVYERIVHATRDASGTHE